MQGTQPVQGEAAHTVRARNVSVNAENAIHNDEGARALGYAGGLVSGVTVYAYMTQPLVARFGVEALAGTTSRVVFFAPVYDGDALAIEIEPPRPRNLAAPVTVRARKAGREGGGEAVALWEVERPPRLPAPGPLPAWNPREADQARPAFRWEAVVPGQPFHGLLWRPGAEENRAWCDGVGDGLAAYRSGVRPLCHPGWVLQQANQAITREFRMTPWIHVSSRIVWHEALRVGDAVEVRAVPRETWEKRGHRWALLRIVLALAGRAALEIEHKTILQVAPR